MGLPRTKYIMIPSISWVPLSFQPIEKFSSTDTYILQYWLFIKLNKLFPEYPVHFIHITGMRPI